MNKEVLEGIGKSDNYVAMDLNVDLVFWNNKIDLWNSKVRNHSSIGELLSTKADGDIQSDITNGCID